MRSLLRLGKYSHGAASGPPALPPAMTPRELALVEAYFNRKNLTAALVGLFGANREAPPRNRAGL